MDSDSASKSLPSKSTCSTKPLKEETIEPIGIPVTGLGDVEPSRKALCAAAQRLKEKGAEVLLTGCAGMTPYKSDIEQASGLKVIDPIHAAVTLALGAVCSH